MVQEKDFYKGQFFEVLKNDINTLKISINSANANINDIKTYLQNDVKEINHRIGKVENKINIVYGFAGGVSFVVSFMTTWFKSKIV